MPHPADQPAPRHSPARLAVLISGSGRTMLNLLAATRAGDLNAVIPLIIASKDSQGVARARQEGLHVELLPGRIPAPTLAPLLLHHRIDWIILAGYLHLLDIPPAYRNRVVNIHPALLPKFGGKGMYGRRVHESVLAAREPTSGCTVHIADDEYDRGRIILQRSCPVYDSDTPDTLAARVFELELEAYPAALKLLLNGGAGFEPAPAPHLPWTHK